jgi:hypothetical protein
MKHLKYFKEVQEYVGVHTAPNKEDSPMHDLTDTYSDDIYSDKGAYYYGDNGVDYMDNQSLSIIKYAKGKPNARIKIYRAVPDINKETNKKIKELNDIILYHDKFDFFPMKNNLIYELQNKYDIEKYTYDEQQKLILDDIYSQRNELKKLLKPLKINDGDWVTINLDYAKEHGVNNLNRKYKILTKTVLAKNLYTDGNSLHEWGYNI